MYGRTVRSLVVSVTGGGKNLTLWQMNGTQGDVWKQANIEIGGPNTAFATQVSTSQQSNTGWIG